MNKLQKTISIIFLLCSFGCCGAEVFAQTTQFTYQGRFIDSTLPQPTNGTYEMQFKAFDAAAGGNQSGATAVLAAVQVVNGIFTVQLDFGAVTFRGEDRFLEISVRPANSQATFTTLAPLQQVTSVPFSIQSLNSRNADIAIDSINLGSLPASNFVQTGDSRLIDDRNPLAGSTNYVQNQNSSPQTSTNFNISGSGSADVFNAVTQFNIGGSRVLSVKGFDNFFGGLNAGANNNPATGSGNTFVGSFSGNANTAGIYNSFFGTDAGRNNQADANAFFGRSSGFANVSGASNSFFGLDSGRFNIAGSNNSLYGRLAGYSNLTDNNSFFGFQAGVGTTTGGNNAFFGLNSGSNNVTGSNNTMIGFGANPTANNLTFATAIGAFATVSTSNTIVLGTASTGTEIPGTLKVFTLGAAGAATLCRNAANQIATCAGGVSGSFIQNSTVLQPSADFNISGGGTLGGTLSASVINSATNLRIAGLPVFSTPNSSSVVAGRSANHAALAPFSTFFGYNTGAATTASGQANTFIGSEAGESNTSGADNSFVGKHAGIFNSTGSSNSFFGSGSGKFNNANENSYFGAETGFLGLDGTRNSFFGFQAGRANLNKSDNTFLGYQAGKATTGGQNTFVGSGAGDGNTTGSENTLVGYNSGSTNGGKNIIAGGNSSASGSQNTVVGYQSFVNGDFNTSIGTSFSASGNENTVIGYFARADTSQFPVNHSTAIGAGAVVNLSNTVVLGTDQDFVRIPGGLNVSGDAFAQRFTAPQMVVTGGSLKMTVLASPTNTGNQPLCLNGNHLVAACENNFTIASDDSLKNQNAQIEKQAAQIGIQQKQLREQQVLIEGLRKIVCSNNAEDAVCQP